MKSIVGGISRFTRYRCFLQRVQKRLCFTDVIDFQLIVTFDSPFESGKKENMIWNVQIAVSKYNVPTKITLWLVPHCVVGSTLCGWFQIVWLVPHCVVGPIVTLVSCYLHKWIVSSLCTVVFWHAFYRPCFG